MAKRIGLIVLLFLLVVKVAAVIARGPSPVVMDAKGYWDLGQSVAEGDWLLLGEPIAYRTPAYPWLIALIQTTLPSPLFCLACLQGFLWVATIAVAADLASQWTGDRRAFGLTILLALPMLSSVTYVTAVLTETLFTFLLIGHLWTVSRFQRSPGVGLGGLVGITLGLAILTRPIAMLLWIADVALLWLGWNRKLGRDSDDVCLKRGWICVLFAGVIALATVSPWLVRNQMVFGKWMLTEFVGRNVWITTFQDGSGAGLSLPDSESRETMIDQIGPHRWETLEREASWRHTWSVSNALVESGLDDSASDRLMKRVATDAIGSAPSVFFSKAARRSVNFWRTRATELPAQLVDSSPQELAEPSLFADQTTWGVNVPFIKTALRYRLSNWLFGNTLILLLVIAATLIMIGNRPTRSFGVWVAGILTYFCVVTGILEIPAYRYRMILEPLALATIASATCIVFSSGNLATEDSRPHEPAH